jgi:hypothetical protein
MEKAEKFLEFFIFVIINIFLIFAIKNFFYFPMNKNSKKKGKKFYKILQNYLAEEVQKVFR